MIVPVIRELAQKYSKAELDAAADAFEIGGKNIYDVKGKDEGEILTNLLVAANVREKMDQGQSLQDALRDHSRSVQSMLKKK